MPLRELAKGYNPWKGSELYTEIKAAHYWGVSPYEFWEKPLEEQAYMVAFMLTAGEVEAAEQKLRERKQNRRGRSRT